MLFRILKASILFLQVLLLLCTNGCQQPSKQWYKGNLHTHSYWSDGDDYPEMIMDWYKSNGYHFVGLSDHNILAQGEKWKSIPSTPALRTGFQEYLNKFGEDWVEYRQDTTHLEVKLKTLEEYRGLFEEEGIFLILQSEEISDGFEGKPIHINATNIQEVIPPQGGNSVSDVMQNNIDAVIHQRDSTGQPMFPHLNHPNFHYAVSAEDMMELDGERFFEVYNGHPAVNNYGDSIHESTEAMWDRINISYYKQGKPLLYGLATDDAHNYHTTGPAFSNAGRGWVMVKAEILEAESIINAMESGEFYASTGVTLEDIKITNDYMEIMIKAEKGVSYVTQFIGYKTTDTETVLLREESVLRARYEFKDDDVFVRAKVVSDKLQKNPFQPGDHEVAWIQPVLLESHH